MKLKEFENGDELFLFDDHLIIDFKGQRKVLSTEAWNGGYREDLKMVFNKCSQMHLGVECTMNGDSIEEHQYNNIINMGFDPNYVTGMETAAYMQNASIKTLSYEDLALTAIITAGVDANAGRVGDPATYWTDERPKYFLGTINIILYFHGDMPERAMTRALVTCTEAKTAALQELMIDSKYSRGIATGTGTDGTILISDSTSDRYMSLVGKHSKLGELIGVCVIEGVKEAIGKQSPINPKFQHNAQRRMARFGISDRSIYRYLMENQDLRMDRLSHAKIWEGLSKESFLVLYTSYIAHTIDQMDWGLTSPNEAISAVVELLNFMYSHYNLTENCHIDFTDNLDLAVEFITNGWMKLINDIIISKYNDNNI